MRVFKVCLQITKRTKASLIIYLLIFCMLALVMGAFNTRNTATDFLAEKPQIAVVNRDQGSAYTEGFLRFLSQKGELVELEDDLTTLQDSLFFHKVAYICIIPEGFQAALFTPSPLSLEEVSAPESTSGYYLSSLVNQYWNLILNYETLLPDQNPEIVTENVLSDLSNSATVVKQQFGTSGTVSDAYASYGYILAYILMVMIMICVSNIFLSFHKPDLTMRTLCAPLRPSRQHLEMSLYCVLLGLFCWFLLSVLGILFFNPLQSGVSWKILGLLFLNSLVFSFVAMAFAMLCSIFIKNASAQNIASNFISLIFCFLGGVFVPANLLSESLIRISRFVPTYWYVKGLEEILTLTSFSLDSLTPFLNALGIQLGFAAAFLAISLALNSIKNRSQNSYGTIKSQLD